eukprot:1311939-Pyramimonas_sp.AAC.1
MASAIDTAVEAAEERPHFLISAPPVGKREPFKPLLSPLTTEKLHYSTRPGFFANSGVGGNRARVCLIGRKALKRKRTAHQAGIGTGR